MYDCGQQFRRRANVRYGVSLTLVRPLRIVARTLDCLVTLVSDGIHTDFVTRTRRGVRCECDESTANLELPTIRQLNVTRNQLTIHTGAVTTAQISKLPDAAVKKDFTVIATADLIGNHQTVR